MLLLIVSIVVTTPADSSDVIIPADSSRGTTPADSSDVTTSADSSDVTTPTDSSGAPPVAYDTVVVPAIWGILILIGILGNGLVVYVMFLHGELNTTNCYILNLAFSDLAFTFIVVPLTMVHYVTSDWRFGRFMCKFHMYMIYVSM